MCILANDANITAQVKNKITFLDITIRNNEAVIQIVIVLNRLISLKCFANKGVKNKFTIKPTIPTNAINPPINVGESLDRKSVV